MPEADYTFLHDLMNEVSIPEKGILSRTVQDDASSKIVLFAFAPGEELSEHTSSMPAVLYFLRGEAELTLGAERVEACSNSVAHMPPNLRHAIRAKTALIMLLVLIKTNGPKVTAA
jgi:quercetin dioxygenase-like cupin family protein